MYNKEELEIVEYIENQNPKSTKNVKEKINKIEQAVFDKYNKRKAINIKVLESDLEMLKSKALQEGMPYQTLLNSIIHKYVNGRLVESNTIS